MPAERICLAVALQRYVQIPPIALRQRELVTTLARAWGSEVFVVSVDAPVGLVPDLEETTAKLNRYVEPMHGLRVTTAYREGRPAAEVQRYMEEVRADLLIVGSHSKRGPLDVGIGSTAAALSRVGKVPVLLVCPSAEEARHTRELMIPTYPFVFPYA